MALNGTVISSDSIALLEFNCLSIVFTKVTVVIWSEVSVGISNIYGLGYL